MGWSRGHQWDLGIQTMLRELGVRVSLKVKSDASAAIGIVMRAGLGKVRHIDVSQLWIQEKVASGQIEVINVDSKSNLADALTKHVQKSELEYHMSHTNQCHWVAVSA